MIRQKNYNLEVVRMFSFVMVIAIHVANYYCRAFEAVSNGEYIFALLINTVSRVSVPCFFMLSGALLLGKKDTIKKGLQRAKDMLIKLLVWSVLYYLFNTYLVFQDTCSLANFWYEPAEAHLWYLYVLIPIYVMLPFLQVLSNGMDETLEKAWIIIGFIWMAVFYAVSVFKKDVYYVLPIFGDRSYIYYFFVGYLIQKYKDRLPFKTKHYLMIFGICLAIVSGVTMAVTFTEQKHYEKFLNYGNPFVILAAMSFFAMILCIPKQKLCLTEQAKKTIDNWSSCSFGIYIVHIFFLDLYKVNFDESFGYVYVLLPLLVVLLACGSFVLIKILQQSTFLKKLV